MTPEQITGLENLQKAIYKAHEKLKKTGKGPSTATIWGWSQKVFNILGSEKETKP